MISKLKVWHKKNSENWWKNQPILMTLSVMHVHHVKFDT